MIATVILIMRLQAVREIIILVLSQSMVAKCLSHLGRTFYTTVKMNIEYLRIINLITLKGL